VSAVARSQEPIIDLDPSYPYQLEGDLLAVWRPRGRARDARAAGLVAKLWPCTNPRCACSDVQVSTVLLDDRATSVRFVDGALSVTSLGQSSSRGPSIAIDFFTGAVSGANDTPLPKEVAPFFDKPLPGWVLDDIYALWRTQRSASPLPWRETALESWEPGYLLPHTAVFPDARFDHFVHEGAVYQIDFEFCVDPSCDCTGGRLVVLRVEHADGGSIRVSEVASASLEVPDMSPRDARGDTRLIVSLYLDWRARHPSPEERLQMLRAQTRERGAELHRLVRPKVTPAPAAVAGRIGRNDPCPCGSGKKHKRCCGR